ncbi:hypothetical protein DFJ58DRAFT_762804 [Suillus subalutaceus]|uniref:uncharacterized protein n=1 Tax=Suillus subalutaceus TaxID=48586 RepID=UPI001B8680D1|nr:uncharacterized protein DFJ58DRAFT_762804 [Suillus subalutaceus]KAG1871209.1 hypothetical protein DFJ58DRAFT_762804 [Suillus subalutaceus]
MIIDPQSNMVIKHSGVDNPPSYDYVAAQASSNVEQQQPPLMTDKTANQQVQLPSVPPNSVTAVHGRTMPMMQQPIIHHYQNPLTGEHIASLLPPNHPEMICLQEGQHVNETKFGILGILAAIVWFPLGIGLCLLDRRVKCKRCGVVIDNGICG